MATIFHTEVCTPVSNPAQPSSRELADMFILSALQSGNSPTAFECSSDGHIVGRGSSMSVAEDWTHSHSVSRATTAATAPPPGAMRASGSNPASPFRMPQRALSRPAPYPPTRPTISKVHFHQLPPELQQQAVRRLQEQQAQRLRVQPQAQMRQQQQQHPYHLVGAHLQPAAAPMQPPTPLAAQGMPARSNSFSLITAPQSPRDACAAQHMPWTVAGYAQPAPAQTVPQLCQVGGTVTTMPPRAMEAAHEATATLACPCCKARGFPTNDDLAAHVKVCGLSFACSCQQRFQTRSKLMRHCRRCGHEPWRVGDTPAQQLASHSGSYSSAVESDPTQHQQAAAKITFGSARPFSPEAAEGSFSTKASEDLPRPLALSGTPAGAPASVVAPTPASTAAPPPAPSADEVELSDVVSLLESAQEEDIDTIDFLSLFNEM
mmetsp:Transcript_1537/g.4347  ORF Transcript_1537/g.4347 Transcript_1537/m.4347 type:complete len:434 (+) Transcript_1537:103-1404(+)